MKPYSIESMYMNLQTLGDADPVLSIIANNNPTILDSVINREISEHKTIKAEIQLYNSTADLYRNDSALRGTLMKMDGMIEVAGLELEYIVDKYLGVDSREDLVGQYIDALAMPTMPSEIVGMSEQDAEQIFFYDELAENRSKQLKEKQNWFELAKNVQEKRNKLGRPAKIATLIGGLLLSAGITYGALNTYDEVRKNTPGVIDDVLSIGGAAAIMVPLEAMIVSVAATNAGRNSARKRAITILNRQQTH